MALFSKSSIKNLRKEAGHWLRLGHKVHAYRKDVLSDAELANLCQSIQNLTDTLQEGHDEESLGKSIAKLEKALRRSGGCFYPKSNWAENVEMFLVAAILAIGIRSYFVQPFKIPTNSMYPTYNGMTFKIYESSSPEKPPGAIARIWRKAVLGSAYHQVIAPADGELRIPLPVFHSNSEARNHNSYFSYERVSGRKWLILPTTLKEFTFFVGNQPVTLRVPLDFVFDNVIRDSLLKSSAHPEVDRTLGRVLATGIRFKKGDRVLGFEILTGDALFVDRFSYHFMRPKIGDPFVFRTSNIKGISPEHRGKYYIKRLVGMGGDTLSVRDARLYRNGQPAEGAEAFEKNGRQEGEYEGYTNRWRLDTGLEDTIPPGHYYAMGDNSDQSSDSRAWGYVPESEVVGKALFIYYPFTSRFGPAR